MFISGMCVMRHLFIINPAAGKKETTAKLEQQLKTLSFDHEVVYTEGPGDAKRIAAECASMPVAVTELSMRWSTVRQVMTMWR